MSKKHRKKKNVTSATQGKDKELNVNTVSESEDQKKDSESKTPEAEDAKADDMQKEPGTEDKSAIKEAVEEENSAKMEEAVPTENSETENTDEQESDEKPEEKEEVKDELKSDKNSEDKTESTAEQETDKQSEERKEPKDVEDNWKKEESKDAEDSRKKDELKADETAEKKADDKAEVKSEEKPAEDTPYVVDASIKKKRFPVWAIVCIALLVLLAGGYGYGVFYFSKHFEWNTTLNDINVSGMTIDQAQTEIDREFYDYVLMIEERNGQKEQITAEDIDLDYELKGTVKDELNNQNSWLWFMSYFTEDPRYLDSEVSYDQSKLYAIIDQMDLMDKDMIIQPEEPKIVKKSMEYVIKDGITGNEPIEEKVRNVIKDSIERLRGTVDLEKERCYVSLKYDSNDEEVQDALQSMNTIHDLVITYDFGEETATLWGYRIAGWVTLNEDYEIVFDEEAMLSYMNYLKENYKTSRQQVDFDTYYGNTVEITSYVKTAVIDSESEVEELQKMIMDACETGQTEYTRPIEKMFSVGNTYIEINLTAQRMFCYKDGEIILETDIVSGRPSTGCATPPGIYNIRSKSSPAILVGDTYRTPVSYWMPFNGGIGLHDATWQSAFGGMRYLTNGSHGCINLRLDVAKFLYENYSAGDLVILYHLEGTESDETTPAGKASSSPVPVYTEAPTEEPPAEEPPAEEPPAEEPPATEAPPTEAPATEAPATEPPATEAPATEAPAAEVPAE